MTEYESCCLCPRNCKVNRKLKLGYCKADDKLRVARIAPHYWEEPCISGEHGSGAIFFSYCSLRCVYCQNHEIVSGKGKEISIEYLAERMIDLQNLKCHNINLVTPTHYVPSIIKAISKAKSLGLCIPVVYNCSGYENIQTLKALSGAIDIYMPDFKYSDDSIAHNYSNANNYSSIAKLAIDEMISQVGPPVYDDNGMLKKGVIIRVLALPSNENNTKGVLKIIKKNWNGKVIVSLMSQYTPMKHISEIFPELGEKISTEEYEELIGYAKGLRIDNLYTQDGDSAIESFIPNFNLEEV